MEHRMDATGFDTIVQNLLPVRLMDSCGVENAEELLIAKRACVSFRSDICARFSGKGSYVLLDFGRELCGSLRLVVREASKPHALFRITLGESVSEACAQLGEKNSTNDHSPRVFTACVSTMSDVPYGLSGFRFAKVELLEDQPALIQNIFAESRLPHFEKEAVFTSSDPELNRIFDTAAYTLKLNYQNGYIWDGIKRDRLVWSGDLNQEIIAGIYLFGNTVNVPNSLEFLRECTPEDAWINNIPNYSAWWVINLCDWCSMTGDITFFRNHQDYARAIMDRIDACISPEGVIDFHQSEMGFFLDWPTYETDDALPGTIALLCYAAQKLLALTEDSASQSILRKLTPLLNLPTCRKQTRAFQVLAGRKDPTDLAFLEKDGAAGFSTFMAYYILRAMSKLHGDQMLPILKEYFGGMLSRGATTFWEDFDLTWLEGSSRIDELPLPGQKDLHGDFGAYCYTQLRHSLCHGWSSGVTAFIIEHMLGLQLLDGFRRIRVVPHPMGIVSLHAQLPTPYGDLIIDVNNGIATVSAPDGITVED